MLYPSTWLFFASLFPLFLANGYAGRRTNSYNRESAYVDTSKWLTNSEVRKTGYDNQSTRLLAILAKANFMCLAYRHQIVFLKS